MQLGIELDWPSPMLDFVNDRWPLKSLGYFRMEHPVRVGDAGLDLLRCAAKSEIWGLASKARHGHPNI